MDNLPKMVSRPRSLVIQANLVNVIADEMLNQIGRQHPPSLEEFMNSKWWQELCQELEVENV